MQSSSSRLRALLFALVGICAACSGFTTDSVNVDPSLSEASLYDLSAPSLEGEGVALSDYRGKVTLVVNTASQCGFTGQYKGLQALHEEFKDQGFSVLGFPSDDFGGQEFSTAGEVRAFCEKSFQVSFPLFEITRVKAGTEQSPIYGFLSKSSGSLPGWNFGKYLVDRNGRVLSFFPSQVGPEDAALRDAVMAALRS